jgi:hypothetical protein
VNLLDKNNAPCGSEVILYHSRSDSHSSLGSFPFNAEVTGASDQFHDDAVYWLAQTDDGESCVVSYDIVTISFKKIRLPFALKNQLGYTRGLYIFRYSRSIVDSQYDF